MAGIELFGLTLCFSVSLIFTVLGVNHKVQHVDADNYWLFFASLFWMISAVSYFIVFNAEGSDLVWGTFAWVGCFFIFLFMGIADFFNIRKEKRTSFDRF